MFAEVTGLTPDVIDFLDGAPLGGVGGRGGVKHGASVEFSTSANRIPADKAERHSVRNRTGGNLGSVAGQDAVILAINSRVVPGMTTLQCSLGATRSRRGILLTFGSTRSIDGNYTGCRIGCAVRTTGGAHCWVKMMSMSVGVSRVRWQNFIIFTEV